MTKKRVPLPSLDELARLIEHDPEKGLLYWKPGLGKWRSRTGLTLISSTDMAGYRRLRIKRVSYMQHRIMWKMVNGVDPKEIDHINGDKADNRIANLRSVSRIENNRNTKRRRDNHSGVTGVVRDRKTGKWLARITENRRLHYLGYFTNFAEAVAARSAAEIKLGFHPNHGREGVRN